MAKQQGKILSGFGPSNEFMELTLPPFQFPSQRANSPEIPSPRVSPGGPKEMEKEMEEQIVALIDQQLERLEAMTRQKMDPNGIEKEALKQRLVLIEAMQQRGVPEETLTTTVEHVASEQHQIVNSARAATQQKATAVRQSPQLQRHHGVPPGSSMNGNPAFTAGPPAQMMNWTPGPLMNGMQTFPAGPPRPLMTGNPAFPGMVPGVPPTGMPPGYYQPPQGYAMGGPQQLGSMAIPQVRSDQAPSIPEHGNEQKVRVILNIKNGDAYVALIEPSKLAEGTKITIKNDKKPFTVDIPQTDSVQENQAIDIPSENVTKISLKNRR